MAESKVPVRFKDDSVEYLSPGLGARISGGSSRGDRWSLRLLREGTGRGTSVKLPDGRRGRVESWEEEARRLRKAMEALEQKLAVYEIEQTGYRGKVADLERRLFEQGNLSYS